MLVLNAPSTSAELLHYRYLAMWVGNGELYDVEKGIMLQLVL